MITFLKDHPEKNKVYDFTDCMNGAQHVRTVNDTGMKMVYSDVFKKTEKRYWVSMTDNDTGEIVTCEYELIDNTDTTMVSSIT